MVCHFDNIPAANSQELAARRKTLVDRLFHYRLGNSHPAEKLTAPAVAS
jgi:hypothetical protein